eukprot:783667_1
MDSFHETVRFGGQDLVDEVCKRNSEGPGDQWVFGVLLVVFSTILGSVGVLMLKYSHLRNDALPASKQLPSTSRFLWWTANALMLLVPIPFNTAAQTMAPASILMPIGALGVVVPVF